jgi:hypothetical protein
VLLGSAINGAERVRLKTDEGGDAERWLLRKADIEVRAKADVTDNRE